MELLPKGPEAARLRQRKFALIRRFQLPEDPLPGSLSVGHTRCGKPTCRCAKGEGHTARFLTFMAGGKKRVERIPKDWVDDVRRRVVAGRAFQDAAAQRLLRRAVEHLGPRFADYVVGDGEYATAPFLHTTEEVGLPVVARLKENLPLLAAPSCVPGGRRPCRGLGRG